MKYSIINLSLVLFLSFLLMSTTKAQNSQYTESEAKTFSNYAKLASCAQKPLNINCPKCLNPGDGYKFYFFYQTTRINKFNYKIMIHYNDILKKILVTFSGPSVTEHIYIKYIYSAGFSLVKRYQFQIEKEFYQIYFNKLRKILYSKLQKINASGRKNFSTNFVGHSMGGSLATLAAFDMQQLKIVKNPKVYAFAPLRLGDATFVALVNSYVTVYRIVKKSDYLVRIPNCYYSPTYKIWRCFNEKIVREFITKPNFPLKVYVKNYLLFYRKNNTILRKAIDNGRKSLGLSNTKKLARKSKKLNKFLKKKNNNKIKNKKNAIKYTKKDIKQKRKLIKNLRLKKKKFNKILNNLNKRIKESKKTKNRNNTKKIKKVNKKISNQMKKLSKDKKIPKKLKKDLKILLKKNKKLLRKKTGDKRGKAKLMKKLNKFLRKSQNISKKIKKHLKKLTKKIKSNKNKKSSNKHSKKKVSKRIKKDTKNNKDRNKKSKKKSEHKNQKKISPIKNVKSKKNTYPVSTYYTYIPTISSIKYYTPIDTYFTFVYYTQPIGYQIFYNDSMSEYTHCQYSNGISLCEKVITLPAEFTIENHMTYFGVKFDQCT